MSTTRPAAYDQPSGSVEASRRGAHRARVKPALAGLPIVAGVLIVLGVVGGTWYVLGDSNAKDSSPSVEAAVQDDPTSTAPASAGAGATPADSGSSQPQDSSGSSKSGGADVDHGIDIRVLNSIAVQGLALRVADDLKPDGWKVSGTGNSKQKGLSETKVYYGGKDTRATAKALVKSLGFGSIVLDPSVAKNGLVVVLGHDAQ